MNISNFKSADSELERQEQAAVVPRQLIEQLSEDAGEIGLTLTREHVMTLDAYCAHIKAIPLERSQLVEWLGYSVHCEFELSIFAMHQMFDNLHLHADTWTLLKQRSTALASQLRACASAIDEAGERVLAECEKSKALGNRREAWQAVQFEAPVLLSLDDRVIVTGLVSWLGVMRVESDRFYQCVSGIREGVEEFRDLARFRYRPQLGRKVDAIKRTLDSAPIQQMRASLERIEARIQALNREESRLRGQPASVVAALKPQLDRIRAERNELLEERRYVTEGLNARGAAQGRLEALASRLDQSIARTEEATTSASHLQTAWQLIGVYLESCIERLGTMENSQQLGIFVIHFKNFLAQWAYIEQCAIAVEKRLP